MFNGSDLLVEAIEYAPSLLAQRGVVEHRSSNVRDGMELYRHIMTELSDKSTVEHVQQRMCMQLAQVLLRGAFDSSYVMATDSRAISQKANSLK